jgi:hypothetical protein
MQEGCLSRVVDAWENIVVTRAKNPAGEVTVDIARGRRESAQLIQAMT